METLGMEKGVIKKEALSPGGSLKTPNSPDFPESPQNASSSLGFLTLGQRRLLKKKSNPEHDDIIEGKASAEMRGDFLRTCFRVNLAGDC